MIWNFRVLAPRCNPDHVYILVKMPVFSTNRGHIGGSNAAFCRVVCSFRCCEDEEKIRTIVTRLLGELLCGWNNTED
jgi:hypothetical protein